MGKEKFLLVSLSESKAKQLAQAVSNETCRKILDYLAEKEATESELAEKLNVPISTVHYNLQQLQKGGLVTVDEFHYSKKGKEINHYKLANKYIIIAPKSTYGIKEKLKSVLPAALIVGAGAGLISLFSRNMFFGAVQSRETAMLSEEVVADAAPLAAQKATETATPLFSNIALWFFIGAAAALIVYLIVDWIRNK
jgi:DNA-binding transcriptional ArsR family regulator